MSYDLEVWSVERPALPDTLPRGARWLPNGDAWSAGGRDWHVVVGPISQLEPEDIPDDLHPTLPGLRFLTELNLEPSGAPDAGRALLDRTARALARRAHGVIVDRQADTIALPSGVRRYRSARAERLDALSLSWWFLTDPVERDLLESLVALMERRLPEALPRRYGLYEPPQHLYADTGREPFVTFLVRHARDHVVWYPRRPFTYVGLTVHRTVGATRRGFRTHCLSVDVDRIALAQPGWPRALRDFWLVVAALLPCFYGDVRTLRGAERHGGAYFPGEQHPVVNGWWKGLPPGPAHAVVLGEPYVGQWAAFARAASATGDLRWISAEPWDSNADAMALAGGVPADLAQPGTGRLADGIGPDFGAPYPPVWPFGPTHDPAVP